MRNRAKCKLCSEIIESFHRYDYVSCKCGEISVSGGDYALECSAKDFCNFFRIDDQGNEIAVKLKNPTEEPTNDDISYKPTKKDLVKMLEEMVKNYENLPEHAMSAPITHYDYCSLLLLLVSFFKCDSDCKPDN